MIKEEINHQENGQMNDQVNNQSDLQDDNKEIVQEEIVYELKIPEERVAILIGKNGNVKKQVEELANCKLDISKEGDVLIVGHDGLSLFTAKEIVKAIARGFNPNLALQLLKPDYTLEIIEIKDIAGKSKNTMLRLKGRIIGKGGKSREEIERLTDTYISVYGKTISILGEVVQVSLARQAIGMLLDGAMHKTVFRFLEKKKKEIMFG